ncbi:MAG TPA: CDP-glucose 4,6-dehydratase [Burkholderiales bacterium]|nr:CDP-glucose 4,6-dehydratase [Burkholderiales bacterium]
MNPVFWKDKSVFVTGHTGFKGSWLCLWLQMLGAKVTGYALGPPTKPSLFELARLARSTRATTADVRNLTRLKTVLLRAKPDIVIHLAAQSLVRESYVDPPGTYSTNVMGTVNILEAARTARSVRVVVIVTSDKCYENREAHSAYHEGDPMGGYDPYSSSKGCAELVTAAYRRSFLSETGVAVASARAGNVIGGGDWGMDRLVPDALRAFAAGRKLRVRNPSAVRPWQHVFDPLNGYLTLAERLWEDGPSYSGGWNFGPADAENRAVSWVVEGLARRWGKNAKWEVDRAPQPHEAGLLRLDCSKARTELKWQPSVALEAALDSVVEWYLRYSRGENVRKLTEEQIARFQSSEGR